MTDTLAVPTNYSTMAPWQNLDAQLKFCQVLITTGFCPNGVTKPAQVLAIIRTGAEVGIPPMRALRQISVINGRPTMSAELILAKLLQGGVKLEWPVSNDKVATLKATRPGLTSFEGSFTIEEAARAGLLSKAGSAWKSYPAAMLRARVISLVARVVAPDLIGGFYIPEELGAEVDAEGVVVSVPIGSTSSAADETLPPIDGSPFQPASWQAALTNAISLDEADRVWHTLTKQFAGTWAGFSPEAQERLAGAWMAAKERLAPPPLTPADGVEEE